MVTIKLKVREEDFDNLLKSKEAMGKILGRNVSMEETLNFLAFAYLVSQDVKKGRPITSPEHISQKDGCGFSLN